RDDIIDQIIAFFLEKKYILGSTENNYENIDCVIFRTDISTFFISVSTQKLYKKLSSSNILSKDAMDFIRFINFSRGFNGLPLGLSPSNALASIYLEDFENNIRLCLQPNLYNRFVDDIIVIKYINKEDNEDPYNIETLFRNELKK